MGRPIADIKREIIYLKLQYKLLKIKTIEFREELARLEKELVKEVKDVNDGNAKQLQNYKPSKRPSFKSKLRDPFHDSKYPTEIQAEDEYQSEVKGGGAIRL